MAYRREVLRDLENQAAAEAVTEFAQRMRAMRQHLEQVGKLRYRYQEASIRIVFVTHLYDLAESYYAGNTGMALFLRAQREPDGSRTFQLPEGQPLPTSYGEDLYRQVFGPWSRQARV